MRHAIWLAAGVVLAFVHPAAAAAPAVGSYTTDLDIEPLQRCVTTVLSGDGRAVAINTAAGVTLDLAFSNVGADGHVRVSHAAFAIEDQGTQRRLSASAPDPADDGLARDLLRDVAHRCIPGDRDAHG